MKKLAPNSISLYVNAIRSYFQFYDVDIVPSKFKRKVRLPKNHQEDEQAIDASDVRKLLLACNNRRIKAYLLMLASGGMRAVEAAAVRIRDLDFSVSPTRVHIRKEYSKTRVARDVYISDEATIFLKQWLDFKYRKRRWNQPEISQDDIVFTRMHFIKTIDPRGLYVKILQEFHNLQAAVNMDEFKEGMNRRKVTLHSLRRLVKSIISTQAGQDFSEWFLGHSKSPYWTLKETEKREIYRNKIMPYLTFLDYSTLEASGRSIEDKLLEKENEIALLTEAIANLSDKVTRLEFRYESAISKSR
jgi:integrase